MCQFCLAPSHSYGACVNVEMDLIAPDRFWQISSNRGKQLWVYEAEKKPRMARFSMWEADTLEGYTHTCARAQTHTRACSLYTHVSQPLHRIHSCHLHRIQSPITISNVYEIAQLKRKHYWCLFIQKNLIVLKESHYAFSLFPSSSVLSVFLCMWKSLRVKKVKVCTNRSFSLPQKTLLLNTSSEVPPLIAWLCDFTLPHHVTHLYN